MSASTGAYDPSAREDAGTSPYEWGGITNGEES